MKPFTYERAAVAGRGCRCGGAHPRREVHCRRHQPARPDEAPDRGADASDRRQRPGARQDRGHARGRPAHRRPGAQHRSRRRSARAPRLWPAGAGVAGRCVGPVAQQGDHRRQPAAAHPLSVFLRHQHAVQQTPARQRLLGDRRLQPFACRRRRERRLHRHPSQRHGRGHARPRRHGGDREGRRLDAAHSDRGVPSPAGRRAAAGDGAGGGRADHGSDAAEAGRWQAPLLQGARPRLLRLCPGLGRGDRPAGRQRSRRAGRRGPQAVARRGGRSRAAARRRSGDGAACSPTPGRPSRTHSSCRWSGAPWPRRWRKRGAEP